MFLPFRNIVYPLLVSKGTCHRTIEMDIFVQGAKASGSCFCVVQEIQLPEPEFHLVAVGNGSGADDAKLLARLATDLGVSSKSAVLSEAGRKLSRTVALDDHKSRGFRVCAQFFPHVSPVSVGPVGILPLFCQSSWLFGFVLPASWLTMLQAPPLHHFELLFLFGDCSLKSVLWAYLWGVG